MAASGNVFSRSVRFFESPFLALTLLSLIVGLWIWQHGQRDRRADGVIARSRELWQGGEFKAALNTLESALAQGSLRGSQPLHLYRARLLEGLGRTSDAAAEFRAWAPPLTKDPHTALEYALCLEMMGRRDEAEAILTLLITTRSPERSRAFEKLAEVRVKTAIRTAAPAQHRALMDQALSLLESEERKTAEFSYGNQLEAAIRVDRGDVAGALRILDPVHMPKLTRLSNPRELQLLLDGVQYYLVVAAVYLRMGRLAEAQATISSACDVTHDALRRVRLMAVRSKGTLDQIAPFMPSFDKDGIPVHHSFLALDSVLIEGAIWNGKSPDWDLIAWRKAQMRRVSDYGLPVSVVENLGFEGLPQDLDAEVAGLNRMMSAISHVELGEQCPPADLILGPAFLGTLQVTVGDLQYAAGHKVQAEDAYRRAEGMTSVAALARSRLHQAPVAATR